MGLQQGVMGQVIDKVFGFVRLFIFVVPVVLCLVAGSASAQDETVTAHVRGGPWKSRDGGEVKLAKQSFNVYRAAQGVYFNGHIYMEPVITFRVINGGVSVSVKLNVTAKVTDEIPLPSGRMALRYQLARQVMDYPDQSVRKVSVEFDRGELTEQQGYWLTGPKGATQVRRIVVDWYSSDLDMRQRLVWGGATFPWQQVLGGAAAIGGGGVGLLWIRHRRNRQREEEDREKSEQYAIRITGMDTAGELEEAEPGQTIHILVSIKEGAENVKPPASVTVSSPPNGKSVSLQLVDQGGGKSFISEPLVLLWPHETSKLNATTLRAKPGRLIRATVEQDYNSVPLAEMPTSENPEMAGFRLERIGDGRTLLVNPDRGRDGHLGVRFTGPGDVPMTGEQILWRIKDVDEAVITATDERGETFLGFSPTDDRKFAAMFNGLLLARNVPAGLVKVTVMPANKAFIGAMDSRSLKFRARLTPPTQLTILKKNFGRTPVLLHEHEYYVEAYLGGGYRGVRRPKTITGKVTTPDGDAEEVTLTKSQMPWLYTSKLMEVGVGDEGKELVFEFGGHTAKIPVYSSEFDATSGEQNKIMVAQGNIIEQALSVSGLPEDIRIGLEIKAGLVKNALIWHAQPMEAGIINIEIIKEYQKLLESEDFDFGQRIDTPPDQAILPQIAKDIALRYVCEAEQTIINKTVDEQVRYQRGSLTVLDSVFIIMLEGIRAALSPLIGVYTLVTGRTEEGKRANFFERLAGGADALLCLIPLAIGIRRYAKAAQAMRLQAKAEIKFAEHTLGQAHEQAIFTLNAVSAAQLEIRFAKVFRKSSKKSDSLLARIDSIDNRVQKLRKEVANHQDELRKAQDKLDQMKRERNLPKAERTDGIRTTPSAIASAERGVARRQGWLQGKQKNLDDALVDQKKAAQALDQIKAGRYLDREELLRMHEAGVHPAAFDTFDGVAAHRLFEKQAEGVFAAKHPCWAGDNKVFIREPYRRTNWGTKFSISKKVHVRHPEPDHLRLDPDNFAAGDSKFYHWPEGDSLAAMSRSDRRLVEGHVTTIVDTIEKARLCQYHLVGRTANFAGAPASKVWREVFDLPMVIVTPTNVPDFVKQMIRTRVRGAGRNVQFTTLKPQLDVWADLIPKIKK